MQIRKTNGQAIVEMVLVLPIFLLVIMSIIDFGRLMHCWSSLNFQCVNAARAASKRSHQMIARNVYGSNTHASEVDIKSAFWRYRSPMMPIDQFVNGNTAPTLEGIGTSSSSVVVSASFDMELFTPLAGSLLSCPGRPGTFRLSSSATESKE